MKYIKNSLILVLCLVFTTTFAQNKEILDETVTKTYEVKKDGEKTTYLVNIRTKQTQPVKLEKEDKGQLNQDREEDVAVKVEKSITVDNYDADSRKIELSYYKLPDEELRMVATANGLAIISADNKAHHVDDKGVYYIYEDGLIDEVVIVEEFETIK